MYAMEIEGGIALEGEVKISGAKNSSLVIIAASLLSSGSVELHNIPNLQDVHSMLDLLEDLGAKIDFKTSDNGDHVLIIDSSSINKFEAEYELVRKMRTSILVLGPLLARFGTAKVSFPGGCAIGARPVDMHINALIAMGADITIEAGYIDAKTQNNGLIAAEITFEKISVGATENAIMASVLAQGTTIINNAACEPEVEDLCNFLNALGAKIEGAGTSKLIIHGVAKLSGGSYRVISDRIEAGTYAIAALITHGKLKLTNVNASHLRSFLEILKHTGAEVDISKASEIYVQTTGKILPVDVQTAPYPNFPTDLQAQMMALLCLADGVSIISENIFENRFMHVPELCRMGANISLKEHFAKITGISAFKAAPVMATDLRASVSLILAGLAAKGGKTLVQRIYHLDRGYENLEMKLQKCSAKIRRIKV